MLRAATDMEWANQHTPSILRGARRLAAELRRELPALGQVKQLIARLEQECGRDNPYIQKLRQGFAELNKSDAELLNQ
jgi:hypothetical protein